MAAPNFKSPRLVDKAYRRRAQQMPCRVPSCDVTGDSGEVVLCHIRRPYNSGTGLKPPDSHSLYLCSAHHAEFDQGGGCEWLVDMIFIPEQEMKHAAWASQTAAAWRKPTGAIWP